MAGDEQQERVFDSARIDTTPPPLSSWCGWCKDRIAVGRLMLVDDTGVPIATPRTPSSGVPLCGECGWRFHGSESKSHDGTYVYDPDEGA